MSNSSQYRWRQSHQVRTEGNYRLSDQQVKVVRKRPRPAELSPKAQERLKIVECAKGYGATHAAKVFQVSRATVYRWLKRYDPRDVSSLEDRSRRPHKTRKCQWRAAAEQAVLAARQEHPRWGKAKLRIILERRGLTLAESTIGRILASLRQRQVLIAPLAMRVTRRQAQRPYATRLPKDKRHPTLPGELIQLDTMHLHPLPGVQRRQFTAVDMVSRLAVLDVRQRATAGTAAAFLDELVTRFPFPIKAIQVDGGSEFMAEFEEACKHQHIELYVLPPRSPKLNGRVERLNGTSRREFWECYEGNLDLPTLTTALREWERQYNTERPHQALGQIPPAAFLASLNVSYVSN